MRVWRSHMFGLPVLHMLSLISLVRSLVFVAKPRRMATLLPTFRSASFGQPTSKVRDITQWLDNENIKSYAIKRGVNTYQYTGIKVHLRDSFHMSIITEEAAVGSAFAETAIVDDDKKHIAYLGFLGYGCDVMRHDSMEELGEHIKIVKAAADKGELVNTYEYDTDEGKELDI